MDFKNTVFILFFIFVNSCEQNVNYYKLPSFSLDENVNAVIEIPAGTNKKYEFNNKTKTFEIENIDNIDRTINYLPYLGNYGFIPSTFADPKTGGDGDALDILVLSESAETGTVIETIPIAMLKLIDDGEIDYKIIAIPSSKQQQIINATSYLEFSRDFPEVKMIIETWFLNYNKSDKAKINGWADEKQAIIEIKKNLKIE